MTTTDKASSRDQSDAADQRLRELHEHGNKLLLDFADNFAVPYRLTLIARNPDRPNGGLDVVIGDDDGRPAAEALLRRMLDTAGSRERTGVLLADRLIAISAFRYALGRMTNIPEHVADWLIANKEKLSRSDRTLIVREINEAAERRHLGMECDAATWFRLRTALGLTLGAGQDNPPSLKPPSIEINYVAAKRVQLMVEQVRSAGLTDAAEVFENAYWGWLRTLSAYVAAHPYVKDPEPPSMTPISVLSVTDSTIRHWASLIPGSPTINDAAVKEAAGDDEAWHRAEDLRMRRDAGEDI